jgi:hypothetical protein
MANSQHRTAKGWLWFTKRNARNRGLLWGLSDQTAIKMFSQPCHWCGHEPEGRAFNGIDRVNSEPYYRKSNCVPCCWPCNRAKASMTARQWQRHVHRLSYQFFKRHIQAKYHGRHTLGFEQFGV